MVIKTKAIRIERHGGPEVLNYTTIDLPVPGPGEVRLKHTAIGLNFIDTYYRTGLYPAPLPTGLGNEAAGVIEALGAGVDGPAMGLGIGTRVVYTGGTPMDGYSRHRNIPADRLVPIPPGITDEQAAAVFLKGLTAWYLLRRSYRVQRGDPILLHAAAGGVGSLASQWANHLGATVIGVVSTEVKAKLALSQGCHHVILSGQEDVAARVRELTGGEGVAAVYDSVGRDTFFASLDALRPHGVMVSYGNASGPVAPFAPAELARRHSLYLTRPVLFDFVNTRERLLGAAEKLFGLIGTAVLRVQVNQRYSLAEAAQAHRDLESRKTIGSTVLIP
jgi:NADPH2:quinone reductase